jgi:CheY-like chemotaxis protein/HPt (histidine-containing phosphotransfer) domain-containing protein
MDSQLEVESEYGKGSDFSFTVINNIVNMEPIGDFTSRFHEKAREKREYVERFHAPVASVLVVDDTQMNLEVIKGLLKKTKIAITTCASGYEALDLLKKKSFDLILMDHRMPGMDGVETFQAMKEEKNHYDPSVPCIILTANAIAGAKEEYLKEGFTDYLSKPVVGEELENMLLKYLPAEKVEEAGAVEEEAAEEVDVTTDEDFLTAMEERGLDTAEAMKYCGVTELYRQMVSMYAAAIYEKAKRIRTFLEEKDYSNYVVEVHSLKSSSKTIGLGELSQRAKELELAGKNGEYQVIEEKTEAVLKAYESTYDLLEPFILASEES